MNNEEWLKQFRRSSVLASFIFGIPLLIALFCLQFYLPEPSHFQRQIARVIVAFTSGFFAYFFVGSVVVTGTIWGLRISATAGFALFSVVMFIYNPFALPEFPKGQATFSGETLGGLVTIVDEAYANQETAERIVLELGQADRLRNFALQKRDWTGQTWAQLAQRICTIHACLKCESTLGSRLHVLLGRRLDPWLPESITIKAVGELEKRCLDPGCVHYTYSCKY